MMIARVYRMTIATVWYDAEAGGAIEYEMHFKIARTGNISENRVQFAKRCTQIFQQYVYNHERRWPPKRKVRIGFEREQPAEKQDGSVQVETRSMMFVGRQHKASPLPSRKFSYEKRKRVKRNA